MAGSITTAKPHKQSISARFHAVLIFYSIKKCNGKISAKIELLLILAEIFVGVFRRGNKPSVLPRDSKTSGATTKMARRMPSRKTLKREEPPV